MLHRPAPPTAPDPDQLLSVTTVRDRRPGRVLVQVVGEVDSYTAPALDLCLHSQATRSGVRELVVDLGRVTFLDAAGVNALALADRRCRSRGARLVIRTGGRSAVLRALEVSGLTDLVAVDPAGTRRRARPTAHTRQGSPRHVRDQPARAGR